MPESQRRMSQDMPRALRMPATLLITYSRAYNVGESQHARGFSVFAALAGGSHVGNAGERCIHFM